MTSKQSVTLKSYAKVNLYLEVVGKRADGYHEIRTLFSPIDLFDTICIEKADNGISVRCDNNAVPSDERNIAHKAAALFFEETGIKSGATITIQKRIPVAAGLGGGSSNAATALIGLNQLFNAALTKEKLIATASKLGADVPFFINCEAVYAEGIGDVFVSRVALPTLHFLLINPIFEVPAAWAYQNLNFKEKNEHHFKRYSFDALNTAENVATILKNSLEEPVSQKYPIINEIKNELKKRNALGALMSGSGPTVFGIYNTCGNALQAMNEIKAIYPNFFMALVSNKNLFQDL